MTRNLEKRGKRGQNGRRLFFYSEKGKYEGKPHILGGDSSIFQCSTWIQKTPVVSPPRKIQETNFQASLQFLAGCRRLMLRPLRLYSYRQVPHGLFPGLQPIPELGAHDVQSQRGLEDAEYMDQGKSSWAFPSLFLHHDPC